MIAEALPQSPGLPIATRNPCRLEGDHVVMTLSQGKETIFDLADLRRVAGHRWYAIKANGRWYAETKLPAGPRIYMHRLLLDEWGATRIKHRSGNTLDNRRDNLSPAGIHVHRVTIRGRQYTYYEVRQKRGGVNILRRFFPYSSGGYRWAERWLAEQRQASRAEGMEVFAPVEKVPENVPETLPGLEAGIKEISRASHR